MNRIALDIETARNESLLDALPPPQVATGNLVDPAKIAAKQEAARQAQLAKMALDPRFARVLCATVAARAPGDPQSVVTATQLAPDFIADTPDDAERKTLRWLWDAISDCDQLVTFNGANFDVPFLTWRSLLLGIRCTRIECGRYRVIEPRTPHLDVCALLQAYEVGGSYGNPLDLKCDLPFYARHLLKEDCPYGEPDKSQLGAFVAAGRGDYVKQLNQWDAVTTLRLAEAIAPLAA